VQGKVLLETGGSQFRQMRRAFAAIVSPFQGFIAELLDIAANAGL
jgi:hypothetical protein